MGLKSRKLKTKYFWYILSPIIVGTIYCFLIALLSDPIFYLSENQILYLFSTSAQVVAGLFGLSITGYIFMNDRLNNAVIEDDSLYDVVEDLKKQYYTIISIMGVLGVLAIILSLLNITVFDIKNVTNKWLHKFILDQTILIITAEIVLIIFFSCKLIDPNRITKTSDILKSAIISHPQKKGDLAEFLRYYNLVEKEIVLFSGNLIGYEYKNMDPKWRYYKEYQPSIVQATKILSSKQILDDEIINEINEMRKYRNSVVHGTELEVDLSACERVKKIYEIVIDKLKKI